MGHTKPISCRPKRRNPVVSARFVVATVGKHASDSTAKQLTANIVLGLSAEFDLLGLRHWSA